MSDQPDAAVRPDDIVWIVNDNAELGVKVGDTLVFLYKGRSLQYGIGAKHSDGSPMRWRRVHKREFGECCHPPDIDGKDISRYESYGGDWQDM